MTAPNEAGRRIQDALRRRHTALTDAVPRSETEVRLEERRAAYEYLKEQAEALRRGPGDLINRGVACNNMTRVAGEVLRGLHAKPKVTNPDLWK